jgi:hypothetical protein
VLWLNITLAYLLVCWLLGLILVRVVLPQTAEDRGAGCAPSPLTSLVVLLFAPVIIPYIVCLTVACVARQFLFLRVLRRTLRTVREYEFTPVDLHEVGDPIREHFESATPDLLRLGFEPLGDFRLKPEPIEVHDRIFLSDDGEVLACVCVVLDTGSVALISVLDDGTCIHTSSVQDPHPELATIPEDRLCIIYRPSLSVADLHTSHRESVREQARTNSTRVMRFRADQFRAVLVYDQRIFNRWRYRHGGLDSVPPLPELHTLRETEPAVPGAV